MATLILKTSIETLPRVIQEMKHALPGIPTRLRPGNIILVSRKRDPLNFVQNPIRFRMNFVRVYRDTCSESEGLWGKHWPWILECTNAMKLAKPFDMYDLQVTKKDYGRGGTMVYLEAPDEAVLRRGGYFEGISE